MEKMLEWEAWYIPHGYFLTPVNSEGKEDIRPETTNDAQYVPGEIGEIC